MNFFAFKSNETSNAPSIHSSRGLPTRGLQEKAGAVMDTAEVFRLHALNVKLTSSRYGEVGRCVGVVAGFLGEHSRELTQGTAEFRARIGPRCGRSGRLLAI